MIKIAVVGCTGKLGSAIIKNAETAYYSNNSVFKRRYRKD